MKDYLEEDYINDLEETKNTEVELLEERIANWDKYLEMLEFRYTEADRIQRDKLLMDQLNVDSQEEIYNILEADMTNFVSFLDSNNMSTQQAYANYNTIFTNFLNEYKNNVLFLQQLQQQQIQLMNSQQFLQANNALYKVPQLNYSQQPNYWTGATNSYSNLPTDVKDWSSYALAEASKGNRVGAEYAYKMRQIKLNSRTDEQNALALSKWTQEDLRTEIEKRLNGYASGIENGPITETGLAMLHGSESNPEYVLNNDQAYTLLKNLATIELNNATSGMGDESQSSIGITGLAKTELEGINTLITQVNSVISSESLTNSQIAELMNIISNLLVAEQSIQKFVESDFNQDTEFYTNILDDLDELSKELFSKLDNGLSVISTYLSSLQGLINNGIGSINGLVGSIGSISQGIATLGTQIDGLGSSITSISGITSPSYDELYGSTLQDMWDIQNTLDKTNWKTESDDWSREALEAANRGNREEAYYYISKRLEKLQNNYQGTGGEKFGKDPNQVKLIQQVEAILTSKGYATGIERGPVTNTGIAMLHGTTDEPEYVLNNDQAYQILRNLATQEIEINSSTASMGDLANASIGITELVESELEGMNTIIVQLNGILNGQALTNSQIAEIMNMISNIQQYSIMLHQAVTDEYIKNDTRFITLCEYLDRIIEQLEFDLANDKTNFEAINSSIRDLGNSLISGLNGLGEVLNSGLSGIGSMITSGLGEVNSALGSLGSQITSIPDYDSNYGDFLSGGLVDSSNIGSSSGWKENSNNWAQEALDAAARGNKEEAYHYIAKRAEKLAKENKDANIPYGNDPTDQSELINKVNSILASKGYAEGIENGPITDTGLAMLHGTDDKPEYVLNNDQAYQLLRNLATQELNAGTSSMEDESQSSIGVVGTAKTELEGINTMITQLNALITGGALTNSQLAEIMNLISNLQSASLIIQQSLSDEFIKNDTRFTTLFDILDNIKEVLDKDYENDKTMFEGIKSELGNLGNNLKTELGNLSTNINSSLNNMQNNLNNQINEVKNQVSNTNKNYTSGNGSNTANFTGPVGNVTYSTSVGGTSGRDENGNIFDMSSSGQWISRSNPYARRTDLAGTIQYVNGKYIYYDSNGYATKSTSDRVTSQEVKDKVDRDKTDRPTSGTSTGSTNEVGNTGKNENGNTIYYYDSEGKLTDKDHAETKSTKKYTNETSTKYPGTGKGYANGIENGPVTTTGEAMLHGTINSPEYVLNNDQAYQLLKNISTNDYSHKTTSMADEETSNIDSSNYAETTMEGINTILVHLNALVNSGALTNSQLAEIMNMISNFRDTQSLIYNLLNDGYLKLDTNFSNLASVLNTIKEYVINDFNNDKLIFDAINQSVSDLNSGLKDQTGSINSNVTQTGNEISSGLNGALNNINNNLSAIQSAQSSLSSQISAQSSYSPSGYSGSYGPNGSSQLGTGTYNSSTNSNRMYGPQGDIVYSKTVGGTLGTDGVGNKYMQASSGAWIQVDNTSTTGVSMGRRIDLAGTTQYVNGRYIYYDSMGYAASSTSASRYDKDTSSGNRDTANVSNPGKSTVNAIDKSTSSDYEKVYYDQNGRVTTDYNQMAYYDYVKKSSSSSSSSGSSSNKSSSSGTSGSHSSSTSSKTSSSSSSSSSKYTDTVTYKTSSGTTVTSNRYTYEKAVASGKAKAGYADGLENGPVTFTGLAMLHGTPSKPEYVVNNDQAYSILRNLASLNMPEFESNLKTQDMVQYILNGDVNLETDTDPSEFWTKVTQSMQMRSNVTKNNRR